MSVAIGRCQRVNTKVRLQSDVPEEKRDNRKKVRDTVTLNPVLEAFDQPIYWTDLEETLDTIRAIYECLHEHGQGQRSNSREI